MALACDPCNLIKQNCSKNEGEKNNIEKVLMKENYCHIHKYNWEDEAI